MLRRGPSARNPSTSSFPQEGLLRANTCTGGQVSRGAGISLQRSLTQVSPVACSFTRFSNKVQPKVAALPCKPAVPLGTGLASVKAVAPTPRNKSENGATETIKCPVDGLAEFLASCGLDDHLVAASKWCEDMGAVDMEEVLENRSSLSDALGLSAQERARFTSSHPIISAGHATSSETLTSETRQPSVTISPVVCTQASDVHVSSGLMRAITVNPTNAALNANQPNMGTVPASSIVLARTRTSPTTGVEMEVAKRRADQAYIPLEAWAAQRFPAAPMAPVDRGARKVTTGLRSTDVNWCEYGELEEESYFMAKPWNAARDVKTSVAQLGWDARKYNDPDRGYIDPRLVRQQAPTAKDLVHPFAQSVVAIGEAKAAHGVHSFEQLRASLLKEHGPELKDNLSNCFEGNITIEPAPVSRVVQQRFLEGYAAAPFADVIPTYHGSNASNYESICRRGLLIPGKGNELKVEHGAVHGRGIYTARIDNPSLSRGFCTDPSMLICGVVDDAEISTRIEKCGRFSVGAKSQTVKHVGSAVIVADDRRVAPLFQVTADNFKGYGDDSHSQNASKVLTLEEWLANRAHVSIYQPRHQEASYISKVTNVSSDPMPCGPRKHFVDIGKGQVLDSSSGEKAFMPPVAENYSYEVKQKRAYDARKRDVERAIMRAQKFEKAGMAW